VEARQVFRERKLVTPEYFGESAHVSSRAHLAGLIALMLLGCATNQTVDTTETPQERAEIERLVSAKRDRLGRLGTNIDRPPAAVKKSGTGN
jgi:hypothetical protein